MSPYINLSNNTPEVTFAKEHLSNKHIVTMNKIAYSVIFALIAYVYSLPANVSNNDTMMKKISDCFKSGDSYLCLKEYAVESLNEIVENDRPIQIGGIINIVRNHKYNTIHENIVEELPINKNERSGKLDEILSRKVDEFLQSRSVHFDLGSVIEGRKKKDKYGGMMLLGGIGMAGMMMQLFMTKIAFLAGAALLISKIALLLSTLIGLKKLIGSSGGTEHAVVYATAAQTDHGHGSGGSYGGSTSGGWQKRSLDGAQNLAYRGYVEELEQYKSNDTRK